MRSLVSTFSRRSPVCPPSRSTSPAFATSFTCALSGSPSSSLHTSSPAFTNGDPHRTTKPLPSASVEACIRHVPPRLPCKLAPQDCRSKTLTSLHD